MHPRPRAFTGAELDGAADGAGGRVDLLRLLGRVDGHLLIEDGVVVKDPELLQKLVWNVL
jgi:hypothetical protein